MTIKLPKATTICDRHGRVHTACSACLNTPAACFCADNGVSRMELNAIAVALVFGYDLSGYDEGVIADVRGVLDELRLPVRD